MLNPVNVRRQLLIVLAEHGPHCLTIVLIKDFTSLFQIRISPIVVHRISPLVFSLSGQVFLEEDIAQVDLISYSLDRVLRDF
jgi:hypothetical protein